jgi:NAD(P)-dependent dehydrogenase (short-subunit alcohol dehydrogenase family)
MKKLQDKVALVTGGAKRIGKGIAFALAEEGANVAITYRDSADEARETARELEDYGIRASAIHADLRVPESIRAAVSKVAADFGRLDILVNNAGLFQTAALDSISVEQWDSMFDTNTRAPFLAAQAAYSHLKAANGRIINLGSLGGAHPWPTHGHYCTSKAALHMLTQVMSKAFAPEISVNCVAPGMIAIGAPSAEYEHFARKTPMKRNGTVEEVVAAVLFFATGPHFITGQVLGVDGGLGL